MVLAVNAIEKAQEVIRLSGGGTHFNPQELIVVLKGLIVHMALHTEHKRDGGEIEGHLPSSPSGGDAKVTPIYSAGGSGTVRLRRMGSGLKVPPVVPMPGDAA